MKGCITLMTTLFIFIAAGAAFPGDGESPCGYEMKVVPVETRHIYGPGSAPAGPAILDAWTTNDPYGNPYTEVYDFTLGADTLAFVVEYYHTGGLLPRQWAAGWNCETNELLKGCRFDWTVGFLPEGTYLLINYFEPVMFKAGEYDWASKVGDAIFGWPNVNDSRPECFMTHN